MEPKTQSFFKTFKNRTITLVVLVLASSVLIQFGAYSESQLIKQNAQIINKSGLQRMLSQKIAKSALVVVSKPKQKIHREELDQASHLWNKNHIELSSDMNFLNNTLILEKYKRLNTYLDMINQSVGCIQKDAQCDQKKALTVLSQNEALFLPLMNEIVKDYEDESKKLVTRLDNVILSGFAFLFLLVFFWLYFYLVPDTKRIINILKQEADSEKRKTALYKLADIGEAAAHMGHELLNHISIIKSSAAIITKSQENLNDTQKKYLEKIEATTLRSKHIIDGIKTLSRSDMNEVEDFDVLHLIGDCKQLLEVRLRQIGVQIDVSNLSGKDIRIKSNKTQCLQVIYNLLKNSIDALEKTKDPFIKVEIFTKNELFFFSVFDNGEGIKKENRDKIMDSFFTTKKAGKGTGLGLPLCLKIAKKFGGDLILNTQSPLTNFVFSISRDASKIKFDDIEDSNSDLRNDVDEYKKSA